MLVRIREALAEDALEDLRQRVLELKFLRGGSAALLAQNGKSSDAWVAVNFYWPLPQSAAARMERVFSSDAELWACGRPHPGKWHSQVCEGSPQQVDGWPGGGGGFTEALLDDFIFGALFLVTLYALCLDSGYLWGRFAALRRELGAISCLRGGGSLFNRRK